ncbi:hypothetical protein RHMOL_Rhmol11G0042100 [Rhododendron molle]|uniref:Uncharacterized protein n=1 Tax=Rhododendron molle TaxID=49168 RepID=A0ACC0LPI9_RHOML|nr:hypothetical protein RHMOL_Rhmol11G0042100 [Rhododendron molle]
MLVSVIEILKDSLGERADSKLTDSMLRLAEHVAAKIALNTLANRGPSKALPSKVLHVRSMFSLEFVTVGDGYIAKVGPKVV